ncbi:ATP-binding protein [Brochothrix thermosphacta]|uniref:ATP-binding protein n=1 Tax=Brochothrix thermosphacta TaxID=2756 RepID=UPI00083FA98A|nr:ATP-binding protein [Brochothrix thermosphacta]ODJ63700.1 hypothetical protein BFR36_11365 [Brochothrix thermosphacta]
MFILNIDEKSTEKILSNLLSNAIHYTEENTIISIKIETNSFKVMNFFDNKSLINADEIGKPFISYGNNASTVLVS